MNKTKQTIINHFFEYIKIEEIDKIRMSTLASRCGYSRQTMYKHFSCIEDIIMQIITYDFSSASRIYYGEITQNEFIDNGLSHMVDHSDFYQKLYFSIEDYYSKDYLFNYFYQDLFTLISHEYYPNSVDEKVKYELIYYCKGLQSILYEWIINKNRISISEIRFLLRDLIPANVSKALIDHAKRYQ